MTTAAIATAAGFEILPPFPPDPVDVPVGDDDGAFAGANASLVPTSLQFGIPAKSFDFTAVWL